MPYGIAFIILIVLVALILMRKGDKNDAVTIAAEEAGATGKDEEQKEDTPQLETKTTETMEQKEDKEKRENKEKSEDKEKKEENNEEQTVNTRSRDSFLETLTKIGCQYETDEENDRIVFDYQGEHFIAEASNERCYVQLWDTFWGQVELYDIDEFSRLRKAINTANVNCNVTTIYTIDEEGNNVDVHCKKCMLFFPDMPNIEAYLRAELSGFFRAHRLVTIEMDKLRNEEQE